MNFAQWWSQRPGVERFDLSTRAPLYLVSALEPVALLLLITEQERLRPWGVTLLLAVTVAHAVACLLVLRAALEHSLGGPGPGTAAVGTAVGLTAAGLAAGPAAFPAYGHLLGSNGFPLGMAVSVLFCGALTLAVTPMLSGRQLMAVVVVPAVILGVLQLALAGPQDRAPWTVNYLLIVGTLVFIFRSSVWVLGLVWEIDRARAVQPRLAVAEERLRVARDLHDVLGRNLTLIAVHSELAASLVRRSPDEATTRMLDVRQTAQDTMREVREVVGGHRTADLDVELTGARAVLRSAGIDARVIGDGSGLPPPVQAVLGWAVREASTNILRHADPTQVTVDLDNVLDPHLGPVARLRIENDGVRPSHRPSTIDGHGTGLTGLRERLIRAGGDLTAGGLPQGRYRLEARLPLAPAAATAEEPTP